MMISRRTSPERHHQAHTLPDAVGPECERALLDGEVLDVSVLFADLRGVAISSCICLLALLELFFNRRNPRIGRLLVVLVTGRTDGNRNIGRQSSQAARSCNIDVAVRALHHMFALAAFMAEHC